MLYRMDFEPAPRLQHIGRKSLRPIASNLSTSALASLATIPTFTVRLGLASRRLAAPIANDRAAARSGCFCPRRLRDRAAPSVYKDPHINCAKSHSDAALASCFVLDFCCPLGLANDSADRRGADQPPLDSRIKGKVLRVDRQTVQKLTKLFWHPPHLQEIRVLLCAQEVSAVRPRPTCLRCGRSALMGCRPATAGQARARAPPGSAGFTALTGSRCAGVATRADGSARAIRRSSANDRRTTVALGGGGAGVLSIESSFQGLQGSSIRKSSGRGEAVMGSVAQRLYTSCGTIRAKGRRQR